MAMAASLVQVLFELLTWRLPWSFVNMSPFKVGWMLHLPPAHYSEQPQPVRMRTTVLCRLPLYTGRRHSQARRAAGGATTAGAARPRHHRLGWAKRLRAADAVRRWPCLTAPACSNVMLPWVLQCCTHSFERSSPPAPANPCACAAPCTLAQGVLGTAAGEPPLV